MSYYEYHKCPACGYDFNSEHKTYEDLMETAIKENAIIKEVMSFSLDGDEGSVVVPFLKLVLSTDNDVVKIALENYLRTAKIKSLNVAKKFIIRVMKNRHKKIAYERETIGYLPPEKE